MNTLIRITSKKYTNFSFRLRSRIKEKLYKKVLTNLEEGGRGVGNIVEEYFTTPLSTYVFDNRVENGQTITIEDITGLNSEESELEMPRIIANLERI